MAAALGRSSRIATPERIPDGFDLVVIGTPVWSGGAAPAVNRYIDKHRGTIGKAAFFCTEGGAGDGAAFARMERRLGKAPIARLALTEKELNDGAVDDKLAGFVGEVSAART